MECLCCCRNLSTAKACNGCIGLYDSTDWERKLKGGLCWSRGCSSCIIRSLGPSDARLYSPDRAPESIKPHTNWLESRASPGRLLPVRAPVTLEGPWHLPFRAILGSR